MIHLYNKDKVKIAGLIDYKNLSITSILKSSDKVLLFLPQNSKFYFDIEEECYIRTKENEYVIKEKNIGDDYAEFKCNLNLEDLEGKPWERYASEEQPIDKSLSLALAGTGWIVGYCDLKKKRTVRISNCSSLDVIKEIKKTYRCDLVFNTLTKTIDVYECLGEDKGTYFVDSLNLKSVSLQGNSYDFYTRLIPIGKDNLKISSINSGKEYVENHQYSNKIKTCYWLDDRYTVVENLKEDAISKLKELSKPYKSYSVEIVNLARLNNKYKNILDYNLGDTIYLISKNNKFRDKQRIVKIIEYPNEHELDTVELTNTTLSFEDIQTQFQDAADTVFNITTDNGTIDGSTVDEIETDQIKDFDSEVVRAGNITATNAKIYNLEAHNVTVTGRLNAVEATIGTLEVNVATIDKITVTHTALINDLQANKASITQLDAINANIKILEADVGNIETLVNGNLSSENIQAGGITSDKLTIANGFIKNAMIDSLDVSKINAGDISTDKFRVKSSDGGIEIVGATQQFKDKNNKIRIQMGKDAQGNFNFIIRGEDGTTTLIDHTGIKSKAIADDLIVNNMIASNAVEEKQINYSSFTNGFNKDTNTTTLKATKIKLDNQNQSLEVAFNSLKTQADGTKTLTESHSTTISVMQGQINTAINNTQIIKDGQTILLKDDYNRTVQTVNSMNSTIGSHTTQINQANGKIGNVETKVNTVERDLNSISARVSSTESSVNTVANTSNTNKNNITNLTTEVTTVKSSVATLDVNLKGITQRVSNTETSIVNVNQLANNANNKIDNLEIGGRNLLKNSKDSISSTTTNSKTVGSLTVDKSLLSGKTITISLDFDFEGLTSVSGQSNRLGYEMSITFEDGSSFYIGCWNYISSSTKFKGRKSNTQEIPNKPIKSINYSGLYIQCNSTKAYIGNPKLEFGNKNTDYTQAPEDFESQLTTTNNKVASIETNLGSITSRVSSVESTTNSINGQVNNLSNRMNSAETKITDSSIVSTVTKSSTYRTDMDSKVSYYNVVSSINQSAESIKIIASKIDLEGATTIGDGKGNYVKIEGYGYTAYINRLQTMYLGGYMENGVRTPSLYMGASGFDANSSSYSGSYFAMKNYGSYHHIAMRSRLTGQWSIIQFNEAGDITFTPHVKCAFERPAVFRQGLEIRNEYGIDLYDWNGNLKGRISRGVFELSQIKSIDNTLIQVKDSVRCMTWGNTMGTDDGRWGTIYLLRAPDVSSDITLKENIIYTDMKTIIPRLSNLDNNNSLTYQDMYEFYKDIYRSAEYNYIGDDTTVLGIIANDIVDTKVGKKIIKRNESGKLSYLQETRISVTEGALKQAILEIEKLKEEIKQLKAS
ncbi:phage tail spike protein (plasmid) [Paraclostridium bifermentans]|uniref:Phage tail spike protein n=1 Tax=Paraclostridium bifermentans TaxID=1490 RepID=A0ABY8R7P3_PARBF|nr:phage tail spike protein [Paraclostridium bifermentans]